MIRLSINIDNDKIEEVVLDGHGKGLKGTNILCAAVSAISQTALLSILYYNKEGIAWDMKDGHIKIHVKDSSDNRIQIILTSMIVGLKAISKEYPNEIQIED